MKFLCGNCKAKYQIADEKVSGKTLRMKCRRCDHDILIDGHNMAPSNPPPAAMGTGNTRRAAVSLVPAGSRAPEVPPQRGPALPPPAQRPAARSKPPSALSADFRRHVAAPPQVPQRTAPYDLWHVAIDDVPVGPMTREDLGRKVESGAVTEASLCWREGMDDWRPLGELPELAAVLRRSRTAAAPRPPLGRGALPGPQGARSSLFPAELDELEDDNAEPTRIADMTGAQAALGHLAPPAPAHAGSASQPRILVPTPAPAAAPMMVAESPSIPAPRPVKQGNSGLTTGLALGLLGGILLVGGPMMYKTFWASPQPVVQTVQTEQTAQKPELAARDIDVNATGTGQETAPGPVTPTATQPDKASPNKPAVKATDPSKPNVPAGGNSQDDEYWKKMGAEGPGIAPVGAKRPSETSGAASGPSLTAAQLSAVVTNNKQALQRCYESALRATGGHSDTIKVKVGVEVGASGTVKSVSTTGQGLGNMNDCLKTSVKRWRFPASGGESEFEFPLVFQPGA